MSYYKSIDDECKYDGQEIRIKMSRTFNINDPNKIFLPF